MISKRIKKFCCEDISLIENYEEAINSEELWDCHHRLETDSNKSVKELKDMGLYWKRPASELIFLSHCDHASLHLKQLNKSEKHRKNLSDGLKGEKNPMYKKIVSEETRLKMSLAHKGKKRGKYNKQHKKQVL